MYGKGGVLFTNVSCKFIVQSIQHKYSRDHIFLPITNLSLYRMRSTNLHVFPDFRTAVFVWLLFL